MAASVGGIFVGGHSRRMGQPKGLLRAPEGVPLVLRTGALFEAVGIPWVLVGVRPEYAQFGCVALDDEPSDIGPRGGLLALLRYAGDRVAFAVACDMPFISLSLLARLVEVPSGPPIVAGRRHGRWEPLFARFDAAAVLPFAQERCARGQLSLQALFDEVSAVSLETTPEEETQLDDWDMPEDIGRPRRAESQ